jgi:hypothetical protein
VLFELKGERSTHARQFLFFDSSRRGPLAC